ncbi:hypothetical protein [Priestia megaterium]|uniref:hypothetical protein n=1 Tax=Priestia megaterium TaxID=1404 RepID=UPI00207AF10D|nr:hypothetical protein [Priestia megaterium]USL39602.1 hypothetical protein LIT34_30180 [Priestia megaterium]
MDYNELKSIIQQYTNGSDISIPVATLETPDIATTLKLFLEGEQIPFQNCTIQYIDQEQKIRIQGQVTKSLFSDQPLRVSFDLFFVNNELETQFTLTEFPTQWNLASAFPELDGTVFEKIELPNPQLSFSSQDLSHAHIYLSSPKACEIAIHPITVIISNLKTNIDVDYSNSPRSISADISGGFDLKGIGGEAHWVGKILFDTVSNGNETGYTLGIYFPQSWVPSTIDSMLNQLLKIFKIDVDFENCGVILSTLDNILTPSHLLESTNVTTNQKHNVPTELEKGTTFFSTVYIKWEFFDVIEPLFGRIGAFGLSAHLDSDLQNSGIVATLLHPPHPKGNLTFSDIKVLFSPKQRYVELEGNVTLKIGEYSLDLQCSGSLTGFGGYSLNLSLPEKQKQWKNPFGVNGVTIEDINIGVNFNPPSFNMKFGGKIKLGKDKSKDQVTLTTIFQLSNGNVPTALFAQLETNQGQEKGIPLNKLITAFTKIELNWVPLLDKITIKNFLLCIATGSGPFINEFDKKTYTGLVVNSEISFFGLETKAVLQIDYNSGVLAQAELGSPIEIQDFFRISDASGKKGPIVIIDTTGTNGTLEQKKYFYLSASVFLFGIEKETEVLFTDNGFSVHFYDDIGKIIQSDLTCTLNGKKDHLEAGGTLHFDLSNIKIEWESISIKLDVSVDARVKIDVSFDSFLLDISADFSIFGMKFDFSFTINKAIKKLEDIPLLLVSDIQKKGWEYLKKKFSDPGEFLKMITAGIITAVSEAGELLKEVFKDISVENAAKALQHAGFEAQKAIEQLQNSFGPAREQLAGLLKNANYLASDVAKGLSKIGLNDDEILDQLKNAVFPAFNIGEAMVSVFGWDQNTLASRMNLKGFSIGDVSEITKGLFQLNKDSLAHVLKNAGFDISAVSNSIEDIFDDINTQDILNALNYAGFAPQQLADICVSKFNITDSLKVGDLLDRAGVPHEAITNSLKVKFPDSKWQPGKVLSDNVDKLKDKICGRWC